MTIYKKYNDWLINEAKSASPLPNLQIDIDLLAKYNKLISNYRNNPGSNKVYGVFSKKIKTINTLFNNFDDVSVSLFFQAIYDRLKNFYKNVEPYKKNFEIPQYDIDFITIRWIRGLPAFKWENLGSGWPIGSDINIRYEKDSGLYLSNRDIFLLAKSYEHAKALQQQLAGAEKKNTFPDTDVFGDFFNFINLKNTFKRKIITIEEIKKSIDPDIPSFFDEKLLDKVIKMINDTRREIATVWLILYFSPEELLGKARLEAAGDRVAFLIDFLKSEQVINQPIFDISKIKNTSVAEQIANEISSEKLQIIRQCLPELFDLVKNVRSEEHRWKTDLGADLGEIGF